MLITISKFYVNETDKNGQPLIDKNGKPYVKATIKTVEGVEGQYGMSKLFEDVRMVPAFKEGEKVEIEMKTNGKYVNWNLPKGAKPTYMEATVNDAKAVFQPSAPNTQNDTQERILRSQCLNLAATMGAKTPLDILTLARDVYTEVKDWINSK